MLVKRREKIDAPLLHSPCGIAGQCKTAKSYPKLLNHFPDRLANLEPPYWPDEFKSKHCSIAIEERKFSSCDKGNGILILSRKEFAFLLRATIKSFVGKAKRQILFLDQTSEVLQL
jgi:hypothetical protein